MLTTLGESQLLQNVEGMFLWVPMLSHDQYYTKLANASVYLDTHPIGGGTTAMDALWCGVPVITLPSSLAAGQLALAHYLAMGGTLDSIASTMQEEQSTSFQLQVYHLVTQSWTEYVKFAL
jgi:hypothetical protein